jgi:hypothetical protein
MGVLRTPDERFENLPGYPWAPRYTEVDGLRVHHVEDGPAGADPGGLRALGQAGGAAAEPCSLFPVPRRHYLPGAVRLRAALDFSPAVEAEMNARRIRRGVAMGGKTAVYAKR